MESRIGGSLFNLEWSDTSAWTPLTDARFRARLTQMDIIQQTLLEQTATVQTQTQTQTQARVLHAATESNSQWGEAPGRTSFNSPISALALSRASAAAAGVAAGEVDPAPEGAGDDR